MKHKDTSRRTFLKQAAALAAGLAAGTGCATAGSGKGRAAKRLAPARVIGANERIRTGHIGVGGMGTANMRFALGDGNFEPIAVCDLWPPHRERAAAMVAGGGNKRPSVHTYFEEVIANRDVDAVVISTPDHWHALPAIMACEAGKDLYCEKPLATTISEGRAVVEAVRASGSVFQAGTIQRSSAHFQEAVNLVQSGHIGQVSRVATWINDGQNIEGIGNPPDAEPPEGLDWRRYLGWTPIVPFNENRFLYNFRWFLNYSGGKMTDWGTHLLDAAIWAVAQDREPERVCAAGGKFTLDDNRTTPDQVSVLYEYDGLVLSFSNLVYNPYPGYGTERHGIAFFGTLGTLILDRSGYRIVPFDANGGCEALSRQGATPMYEPHWRNFADCVRSRQRCISDVGIVHKSTTISHMGTCAYVAGASLRWDAQRERFTGGDREAVRKANNFAYREYQNGWRLKAPHNKDWT